MEQLPEEIRITYLVLMGVFCLFVAFIIFFLVIYKNKQTALYNETLMQEALLKQQQLQAELDQVNALHHERTRISMDMHDDLGSGLSSIRLISEMLKNKYHDEEAKKELDVIVGQSNQLSDAMREMVWSLNPDNDTLEKFIPYIRQYVFAFFEPSNIKVEFNGSDLNNQVVINGITRRNLFLCIKEICNNIIKHAQAHAVSISLYLSDTKLNIVIQDDGIGIENPKQGNGLNNITKRMKEINGEHLYANTHPGLKHTLKVGV